MYTETLSNYFVHDLKNFSEAARWEKAVWRMQSWPEISSRVQVLFRGIGHSSVRDRSLWRERSTTISDQSWSIIEILSHCQTNTRILSRRQFRRSIEVLSMDESVRSVKTCFCRARYYCRHCHFGQRPETIHKCIHYRTEGKLALMQLFKSTALLLLARFIREYQTT